MLLTLLNIALLLQLGRVSWIVWAIVLLILLAGVSMLVYFVNRFKRGEKESEEDWSLSQRSLFVNTPPVVEVEKEEQAALQETIEETEPVKATVSEADVAPGADQPEVAYEAAEPESEQTATQFLSSDQIESAPAERDVAVPFDDDVWAELEAANHEPELPDQSPPQEKGTSVLGSLPSEVEPPNSARIDHAAPRSPFESPRIEPVIEREPFEPPRIEPILPGERLAKPRASEHQSRPAVMPVSFSRDEGEREPAEAEPAVVSSQAARAGERKIAGSVLNLPPEASSRPLVFGESHRSKEDLGIGSLTNYGKDTGPRAGHGGSIALVVAILLVAGSTLAYLYIPSVNARVTDLVARIRASGQSAPPQQPAVERPRARILPALKPEVNRNMVKIRGAVYNTSDQPIEGLTVEITLQRDGDAPAETRGVAVNPSTLAPGQQGIYELEYDGKTFKSAGVTNLTDKDGQVKYTIPLQAK